MLKITEQTTLDRWLVDWDGPQEHPREWDRRRASAARSAAIVSDQTPIVSEAGRRSKEGAEGVERQGSQEALTAT
jgi:hypothetical protein